MKKNFMCVLFTFTFETAKWITLYNLLIQSCYEDIHNSWL